MKKIVTIQDISCFGKCSLTVALPIISAMGVEAAIIPTAVLSTHTMFKRFTFKDLSDQIAPISEHWQEEGLKFDALYTGYLGSFEQIDMMKQFFADFGEGALKFVDPAMGDNGKLYPAFDEAFAKHMATLCAKADIIDPNLTEACFMLGEEYKEDGAYDETYIKDILVKLTDLGAKTAILTGVSLSPDKLGAMGYDSETKEFFSYYNQRIPAKYHGTGDVFSSSLLAALVLGKEREKAIEIAADFTRESIALTEADAEKPWYGVNFEQAIPYLLQKLQK
ncbi:MAG: pyridoxamine kinase [Ruminococcaceae bacterium]|nr:pyridoxamine kinase [Oscillospiraceae bacterium]